MANNMMRSQRGRGCLIVVAVFFVLLIVGTTIGGSHTDQQQTQAVSALDKVEQDNTARQNHALYVGKAAVRSMMKDPSSATFSDEFAWMKNGHETACGQINAKNSFGAMAGNTPWLAIPDRDLVMVRSLDNAGAFDREWNHDCVGVEDHPAPAPKEFAGVKLGAPVPATLQPYEGNQDVLMPKSSAPADFLGVRFDKTWFTAAGHKVDSGSGTAKGGFAKLGDALARAYGVPSTDTGSANRVLTWKWPTVKVMLQNSDDRDEATLTVSQGKN